MSLSERLPTLETAAAGKIRIHPASIARRVHIERQIGKRLWRDWKSLM
jgi:hypothetical protein